MDDERIEQLTALLMAKAGGGFANNVIWTDELLALLDEVKKSRERGHCPGCDGDHL